LVIQTQSLCVLKDKEQGPKKMSTEEHVIDLIPGFALGCLDQEELLAVSQHLRHCAACRQELVDYRKVVDRLAESTPQRAVPSGLKARVVGQFEKTAQPRPHPERPQPSRRATHPLLPPVLVRSIGVGLGLAALVLVALLWSSNTRLSQQIANIQSRQATDSMHMVALVGTNDTPQTHGYIILFKDSNYGALAVENAPVLDTNHQYQVWLIQNGKRTSGGVFSVNEDGYGTLQITASQPLEAYQSFGITIEPAGGSPGPTGIKVLGGGL
jgi:anti-sigma-K factor RskA